MKLDGLCPRCMRERQEGQNICPHCGKDANQETEVQHQLKPFTVLMGKYLVGDVIGEGGFGITYIGFDLNLETRVAIKEFYPNGYVTREAQVTSMLTAYTGQSMDTVHKWRDSFVKEARTLAKFTGLSGIVGVKDFFQENNTAYIIMEYLEGETLKSYMKSRGGKIPAEELLYMMKPVIASLDEVHKVGLIHRDISPDNLMLLKGGQIKLLDFGAARDYTANGEKSLSVLLKPGYAPEEQYRTKGKQGPWSDVYALCATMYKCITGVTPPESMERMREDELKRPGELGISLSPQVENALIKGMAVFAEDRCQSMSELYDMLYGRESEQSTQSVPSILPVQSIQTGREKVREEQAESLSVFAELSSEAIEDQEAKVNYAFLKMKVKSGLEAATELVRRFIPRSSKPKSDESRRESNKALFWGAIAFGVVLLAFAGFKIGSGLSRSDQPENMNIVEYDGKKASEEAQAENQSAESEEQTIDSQIDESAARPTAEPVPESVVVSPTGPEVVYFEGEVVRRQTGFVLPDMDTRLYTIEELRNMGLSIVETRIARNELYARYGRRFLDESLQAYFDACEWYSGTISPENFDDNVLNEIEMKNRDVIVLYEQEMGYR